MKFTSFDLETTGLKSQDHEIIEFSFIKFNQGQVVDQLTALVKPQKPIPEEITKITNIDNAMVQVAASWLQLAPQVSQFIGNDLLIAYNAPFDKRFLNVGLYRAKIHSHFNPYLCAMKLTVEALKLSYWPKLAEALNLWQITLPEKVEFHRAGFDAYAAGLIFQAARNHLGLTPEQIYTLAEPLKVEKPKPS